MSSFARLLQVAPTLHANELTAVSCAWLQLLSCLVSNPCGLVAGGEDGTALEMAFSRKKIEERKTWLRGFVPGTYLDHTASDISYTDFVNKVCGCKQVSCIENWSLICLLLAGRNAMLQYYSFACLHHVQLPVDCMNKLSIIKCASGGKATC